ncbi:hypothetical protein ACFWVU_00580 [Streptomyces sp. NPDC058686]|uniref:hypothetical protein n=1 Tax=Streptomyces sp. NPDC058686 TaxID=3346599 RepID=UPI0036514D0E
MMLAEPVLIANLNGIPEDVRTDLRGNGKYDRVKLVQYALDNWDKGDPTDSYQNVSLEGRINATEKHEGAQNVRIVRPNPDWY